MKNKILLILIFLTAFFIRFYNYKYPPLLWDEAALGYNSYSILQTGKDEYGKLLPLIFKSFGDYKPGLYVYLALPFVKIFGLNELSVRLPSILIGSLIPIFLYFLILQINKKNYNLALLAAILAIFNPFNITYSRLAWETNILTFELILASYLFFKDKYFWSSIIFASTLYTYQGGKLASLTLIFILFAIKKSKIFNLKFIAPLFILSLPIVFGMFFNHESNRLKVASIFSYPRSPTETNQIIAESNQINYDIFHNSPIFFTRSILGRYFNHFSPEFLTFMGDWQNPRHGTPYLGVLLLPSIFFLVIGLFNYTPVNFFFMLWFLLAPFSSALTRDSVQATRSMHFSIPLLYFTAQGIIVFLKKFKSHITYYIILATYLLSFIYFLDLYFNHMVKVHPIEWLDGYKESMNYLIKQKDKYQNITFTDMYGQPYIYYLFYSKYPPSVYQKKAILQNDSVDTGKVESVDNIKFKSASFDEAKKPSSITIFGYDEVARLDLKNKPEFNKFIKFGNFYVYENP